VAFGGNARSDFEERDLDDLAGLARHLSRALSLRLDRVRLMEDLAARNRVLDDGEDGIVLLDGSLRVIHANLSAKTMLAASDGLTLRQGRLACATPRVDSELQALLRSVLRLNGSPPGSWVALHRKEGAALLLYATRVVSADVSGLLPSTALVVRIKHPERDRSPTPAVLQRLLGLTLGEARAVLAVCQTQSQELAARRVGVARTTLRTQLRHAYQKLGLQDRADLLRLLGRYGFG
jgi:DNA-binding CsgD family transcriptional regulator